MDTTSDIESEIKSCLKRILSKDGIKDLSVNILGTSEKGDGYTGKIVFVHVSGITENGSTKEYDLGLKCSNRSQDLRSQVPIQSAYMNEMYIYDTVLPSFTQFQIERGIKDPFNSVPKCYGTFASDTMEAIVFQNLKKIGYDLWEKRNPLTRKHISMVVDEYGKLHAISVAMKDQQPEKFLEFAHVLGDIFKTVLKSMDLGTVLKTTTKEIYELLKNELDEGVALKWKNFAQQIDFVMNDMIENLDGLKVIVHGDCWNNNFMFQYTNEDKVSPLKVAILDWQLARLSSPILDLSYFIFSCISKDDIENLDVILENYHRTFSNCLTILGSDPDVLYPFSQFLADWKNYSKFGISMSTMVMKVCSTDKTEVVDLADAAEGDEGINNAFLYEIKDKQNFKNRIRHIVKYSVEHGLI